MAAATDGYQEVVLTGELHGINHIGGPCASHDERGTGLMHCVKNRLVRVSGIGWGLHFTPNRRAKLFQGVVSNLYLPTVKSCDSRRHNVLP
jgi:hypothetical protein